MRTFTSCILFGILGITYTIGQVSSNELDEQIKFLVSSYNTGNYSESIETYRFLSDSIAISQLQSKKLIEFGEILLSIPQLANSEKSILTNSIQKLKELLEVFL